MSGVEAAVASRTVADDDPVAELILNEDEASIVAAEATAAAGVWPEPLRTQALAVAESAEDGVIDADLVPTLEQLVTTSLAGGRARRRYTAEGEKLLNQVLARTPAGRERAEAIGQVNRALTALSGRELHSVRVASRTPGRHTVRIEVDGLVLTLGLSGEGATVESVAL